MELLLMEGKRFGRKLLDSEDSCLKKRVNIIGLIRAATFTVVLVGNIHAAGAQSRPNVIFLMSDDHAAHAISAYKKYLKYGAHLPRTPNLDRLARNGMLFVNSFVTNSICGPARATVLTGQYGHLNGVMTNNEALHPMTVTFPRLMQAAGYQTALFGKWHLRTQPVGFTYYEILSGQGPYYNPVLYKSASDSTRYIGYTLDIFTGLATEWLRNGRANDRPFMLMLTFNGPLH